MEADTDLGPVSLLNESLHMYQGTLPENAVSLIQNTIAQVAENSVTIHGVEFLDTARGLVAEFAGERIPVDHDMLAHLAEQVPEGSKDYTFDHDKWDAAIEASKAA